MSPPSVTQTGDQPTTFIRIGGLVAIATALIYVAYQSFLIPPPPAADSTLDQLQSYATRHTHSLILASGLRNLILAGALFFAVGMYVWTSCGRTFAGNPWAALGLLAATALLTTGVISNTLRTVAFLSVDNPLQQSDLFMVLLRLNDVLDTVLQLFSGLMIGGFSVAGLQSARIPGWLAVVGLVFAVSTLVTTVGISWALSGAPAASYLIMARTLLGLIWFLTAGGLMVLRASAQVPSRGAAVE